MRWGPAAIALLAVIATHAAEPDQTVRVDVVGIRPEQGGALVVALFDREETWLKVESARAVEWLPAASDSLSVSFELPRGDSAYAIAAFHDRNGNGKMDMRWLPFPKPREGGGVTGNERGFGKPDFRKARFSVPGDSGRLRIEMRY